MVVALVLPPMMDGITEASITRRLSTPRTRSSGSTTESACHRAGPTGWYWVCDQRRMCSGERGVVGNPVGQPQRTEVGVERLMVGYFEYRALALFDGLDVGVRAEVAGALAAGCAARIAGTQGESTSAARRGVADTNVVEFSSGGLKRPWCTNDTGPQVELDILDVIGDAVRRCACACGLRAGCGVLRFGVPDRAFVPRRGPARTS